MSGLLESRIEQIRVQVTQLNHCDAAQQLLCQVVSEGETDIAIGSQLIVP